MIVVLWYHTTPTDLYPKCSSLNSATLRFISDTKCAKNLHQSHINKMTCCHISRKLTLQKVTIQIDHDKLRTIIIDHSPNTHACNRPNQLTYVTCAPPADVVVHLCAPVVSVSRRAAHYALFCCFAHMAHYHAPRPRPLRRGCRHCRCSRLVIY